ncbi:MAG: ABC-F family ATP-binding cassette domain-containing protein, partial [Eggerthellaceae bacterium]|nr:ABC-F family ATP-binding cassette domain-containing protein [Eggerthellaceae bacterium]
MAFLLGCEKVAVDFPTKTVFDSISLGVNTGDRIGIVGRNGDGKSTLLAILSGAMEPDGGRAILTNGISVGLLGQRDNLDDSDTVGHSIVGDRPEYEWASDPKVRAVIDGIAGDIPWDAMISSLSGGQRRRVDLTRLLVGDWDVLMLDEPTNHLDVKAISWLANHLNNRWREGEGALLVVTHDRWFLDEVCTTMWEVHDRRIEPFEGGFSAYIQQRVERQRVAQVTEERRQNKLRRELAWLARGAQARSTKQKFRIKAAQELIADVPPLRNTLELKRMAVARLGKQVVDLNKATVAYDEHVVLDAVEWGIGPGDRVGIVGENGAGKTTLLNVMQGKIKPKSGFVKIGKTVKFAVLSQHLDELEAFGTDRIRQVVGRFGHAVMLDGKDQTPKQLLERLGFSNADMNEPICDLSGGQKRRLALMLILLEEPNVLILDEPGNDLDVDMLAAVEDLLDGWPGTLVLVTHDRYLMERVTDDQYAILDGKIRHLPGGVGEYLDIVKARSEANAAISASSGSKSPQMQ